LRNLQITNKKKEAQEGVKTYKLGWRCLGILVTVALILTSFGANIMPVYGGQIPNNQEQMEEGTTNKTLGLVENKSPGLVADKTLDLFENRSSGLVADKTLDLFENRSPGLVADKTLEPLGNIALNLIVDKNTQQYGDMILEEAIEKTREFLLKSVPNADFGSVGGEWIILGLARSSQGVPREYRDIYLKNINSLVAAHQGVLTHVKYTEYSRLILALTALGEDVTNIEGYNLLSYLVDLDQVVKQGVNGPAFALLALDSKGYQLPQKAIEEVTENGGRVANREALVNYLLYRGPQEGDVDRTAMMLQALAPYKNDSRVKAFGEEAFKVLDGQENPEGTFSLAGDNTLESLTQAIIAKERWGKDVRKNLEAILEYQLSDGSFEHIKGLGSDLMATEQAFYALVNHQRNLQGKSDIYEMKGVINEREIRVLLDGKPLTFDQAPLNESGRVLVPMRGIFEAFGATVTYESVEKVVRGVLGNKVVILTIGSKKANVNGKDVILDVPAKIVNGRTLVPLRFVGESLDADVDWINQTRTVVIIR